MFIKQLHNFTTLRFYNFTTLQIIKNVHQRNYTIYQFAYNDLRYIQNRFLAL